MKYLLLCLLIFTSIVSCVEVKNYQKQYVNDSHMSLSTTDLEQFEINFMTYREGASGANSGKSGGGCGCN